MPVAYRSYVLQREGHPAIEHTSAHRGDCLVQYVEQRPAVVTLTLQQLKVTDSEAVKPHVLIYLQTAKRMNMLRLQVLGYIQIMQYTRRGNHTFLHMGHAEALEVRRFKLFAQTLFGGRGVEHPVLQLESEVLCSEQPLELLPLATKEEHLFRRELRQQCSDVVRCTLCNEELTR